MPCSFERVLKVFLFIILGTYFVNFGLLGFLLSPQDYDHLSAYYDLAWRFWVSSPGLPHYNPYLCGGRTLGGDPQIPIFHPFIVLVPLLGSVWLIKIEMLLQLGLGAYGLRKVLEHFGAKRVQQQWGLFLFLCGGGVVSRFFAGHVTLGFYFLLPLLLHLSYDLEIVKEPRTHYRKLFFYLLTIIYCGLYKPNFIILAAPALFVENLTRACLKRNVRILAYFFLGIVACLLVNATTYLPASHYFTQFPRLTDGEYKFIPLYSFLANLLLPLKTLPKAFYGPVFLQRHEYNIFLGLIPLFFAITATLRLRTNRWNEGISLLVFGFFSAWMGLGAHDSSFSPLLPFTWFDSFWPGFSSIRVPARFWFGSFLSLTLFSAVGFQVPRSGFAKSLVLLVGMLPLLGSAVINLSMTSLQAKAAQWSFPRLYPAELRWIRSNRDNMFLPVRNGQGVLDCVDNVQVNRSYDLVEGPHLSVESPLQGRIHHRWLSWSRVELDSERSEPFSLVFNMNHSPLWKFLGTGNILSSKPGERLRLQSNSDGVIRGILYFEQPWVAEAVLLSAASWALLIALGAISFQNGRSSI